MNPRPPACKARQIPVYSEFRDRLLKWMSERKYSVAYQKDAERYLSRYLDGKTIGENSELRSTMAECKSNYIYTMVRVYLNFLEDNELLSSEDADYFRKTIPSRKTSPDGFIPSDERVREAYSKIESEPMKTAFSVLAASGIRIIKFVRINNRLVRRVTEIDEIEGKEEAGNGLIYNKVFAYDPSRNVHEYNGQSNVIAKFAALRKYSPEDLQDDFKKRIDLINQLAERGDTGISAVNQAIQEFGNHFHSKKGGR